MFPTVDLNKKYIVPCTNKADFDKLSKNTVKNTCELSIDNYGYITCKPNNIDYDNMVFTVDYFNWLLYTNYITAAEQ